MLDLKVRETLDQLMRIACVAFVISTWPQKLNRLTFPARGFAGCPRLRHHVGMVSLSDPQSKIITTAANADKRYAHRREENWRRVKTRTAWISSTLGLFYKQNPQHRDNHQCND
jgi:hypothetical protein